MTVSLRSAHATRQLLVRCAFVALLACGEGPSSASLGPAAESSAAPESRRASAPSEAEVQRLKTLGYLDTIEDATEDDASRSGVQRLDTSRVAPGYTLYTDRSRAEARLIDAQGRERHRWTDPKGARWIRARLLPGGDLVAVGTEARRPTRKRTRRFVLRMTWGGEPRWRRSLRVHHDIENLPNGRLLTLTMRKRELPEIHPSIAVRDDSIQELSADGAVLGAVSLYETLSQGPHAITWKEVAPSKGKGGARVDLVHANSVVSFDQPHLAGRSPLYRETNLLVTSRHQDVIAVIDWATRELLFTWGQDELSGPHDAVWLANGNFLVFDNGLGRNWSRVIELDPLARAIVWEYKAPEPEEFYSATRGSAQRLPNGNTLITNSGRGQIFEIAPNGDVVWEFLNPNFNMKGKRWALGRAYRYPTSFIDDLIAGVSAGTEEK
jgi:hypothetical protein